MAPYVQRQQTGVAMVLKLVKQGSPTPRLWIGTGPEHARNQAMETTEAPSAGCRQHTKPNPLQSTDKPLSTEPVPDAQNIGSRYCKATGWPLLKRRYSAKCHFETNSEFRCLIMGGLQKCISRALNNRKGAALFH